MKEKCKRMFTYARLVAKSAGFMFAIAGIVIFMVQFIPTYGKTGLIIFVIGGCLWTLDTLWSTLDSWFELRKKLTDNSSK
jgi:hypothetical protein